MHSITKTCMPHISTSFINFKKNLGFKPNRRKKYVNAFDKYNSRGEKMQRLLRNL